MLLLLHGIEPFEFDARIRGAELPIDRADSLTAMVLPANLATDGLHILAMTLTDSQ